MTTPSNITEDKARTIFNHFDRDKSGKISRTEIKEGLRALKLPSRDKDVDDFLNSLDTDHDGEISFEEFDSFVKKQRAELRRVFDELDTNKSGTIDLDEVKASLEKLHMPIDDDNVKALMAKIDTNHDGVIDFNEWQEFLYLAPSVSIESVFQYWADAGMLAGDNEVVPPPTHKPKSILDSVSYLAAGALAGTASRTITAPLERLKIMYQISTARPPSMIEGLKRIYRDGGVIGFFRGNGANVLKVAPESAVKFFTYESMKRVFAPTDAELAPWQRFISGGMAGVAAHASVFPLEVIKTRLAAAPKGTYKGIGDAFKVIAKTEGSFIPFYRGLLPSLLSTIPASGTNLTVYETVKNYILKVTGEKQPKVWHLLACSTASSICGQLVSYPLHVFKARLICQHLPGQDKYNGLMDVMVKTVRKEGAFGLYRGVGPALLKTVPANWVTYLTYEFAKRYLKLEGKHGKHGG